MRVTLEHKEEIAQNLYSLWFRPQKPLRYTAGQFTEIRLPLEEADGRGDKRWFTLSSSPTEELLAITTRLDPVRPSAFKQKLFSLDAGTELSFAEPMGDFVLPRKKDTPLVFVAGGIGITPMRSMIKWLSDTGERRPITLLYAARTLEEVAFRELFTRASINFKIILSKPAPDWTGSIGRLSTDTILELPGVGQNALIYVSGPEPMVETFYKDLQQKGIAEHRLVMDYFPGYSFESA